MLGRSVGSLCVHCWTRCLIFSNRGDDEPAAGFWNPRMTATSSTPNPSPAQPAAAGSGAPARHVAPLPPGMRSCVRHGRAWGRPDWALPASSWELGRRRAACASLSSPFAMSPAAAMAKTLQMERTQSPKYKQLLVGSAEPPMARRQSQALRQARAGE